MLQTITGIVVILIGLWQLYVTYRGFKHTKEHGNASTSPFSALTFYFSGGFGVILLGIAVGLLTNQL